MSMRINRRDFVLASAALVAMGRAVSGASPRPASAFEHGVASGDPLPTRVILWTRVSPPDAYTPCEVQWLVAADAALRRVVARGSVTTSLQQDFTAKVDVTGLAPGTPYYYQFVWQGERSPVGRTKTLPAGRVEQARLAFVSCANLPAGHFNVYGLLAQRQDLDAVVHLGDYLYEFANGTYGDGTALRRIPAPDREILSLLDYRQRHAQYKRDPDLQAVHRQHAFVCVWDDHEVANDAWKDGAANHNPDEGEGQWYLRKRAAIRAYFEWMPIRERGPREDAQIFRALPFGDLADLLMLDTRLYGRDQQSTVEPISDAAGYPADDPIINDARRTLLGFDQEDWLYRQLVASRQRGTPWRLLGQQVMMAQLSPTRGQSLANLDQWDGYRPARTRLFDTLRDNDVDNVVVMTGDAHTSWAQDLTPDPWGPTRLYNPRTGQGVLGVEFVAPAVTSPGVEDPVEAAATAAALRADSPHLKYVELTRRGYGVLDVTRERVQGEIWHVEAIDRPTRSEQLAAAYVTVAGSAGLTPAAGASAPRALPADPAP